MAAIRIFKLLRELLDVAISSPVDGEVLAYNDATGKWENSAAAAGGSSTLLGLTDVTGTDGAGKAPVSDGADTFTLTDVATQAELDAHAADTTSVHGITDTSVLETTSGAQTKADAAQSTAETYADSAVATHSADTTSVHGIADTSALETTTGAQAKADAAQAASQPLDSDLTAIAALATTSFGRSVLTKADAAALRTLAGLVIGTDVQAYDAELAALAGLTSASDKLPYFTGSGSAALTGLSSFIRTLLDDADAATARATLGVTSSATDGWVDDTAETWTYASGSSGGTATFTVPGDQTAKYTVGTRIKLTQTTVKYFVVSADPSYDGTTNTTVTITAGSDYTLANAAISANYHSYEANPQGHPGWFNYAANATGFSSTTSNTARFAINGRVVFVQPKIVGTSNSTNFAMDAPTAVAVLMGFVMPITDNSSTLIGGGFVAAGSASGAIAFRKASVSGSVINLGTNAFTASGTKAANSGMISYEV